MDYEKKYRELIEKIELISHSALTVEQHQIIDTILGEIKESEDEKIRKELITWLQNTEGQVLPIDRYNAALAWLEKQGSITKLSEEEQNRFAKGVLTSCAMSFIDYLDAHKYEGKMCVSNGECEDIENAFHNAMWDRLHRYYCKYIEKQGELKPSKWTEGDVVRHGGVLALVTNGRKAMKSNCEQITIQYPDEWVKAETKERKYFFEELEKQGEQKSDDKVEPKFHEGEWVVFNNHHDSVYRIEKIENYEYTLRHFLGGSMSLSFSHEDMIRLWTIQDAKDGDVLVSNNGCPFIYKKSYGTKARVYCCVSIGNNFYVDDGIMCCGYKESAKPATKEQRDLLFQKMKEAGYEWDAEKLELKKVEQKPAEIRTTGYWNVQDIEQKPADSKIIDLDELVIELEETIGTSPHSRETIKDFFQKAVQKYMKCLQIANGEIGRLMDENYYLKEEQKSAEWSGTDIMYLENLIAMVDAKEYPEYIKWLISIRDRVQPQPKQEWSEKDNKNLERAIWYVEKGGKLIFMKTDELVSWLKSLKNKVAPQKQWKPSEEQMNALDSTLQYSKVSNNSREHLNSLYNDLKKLTE